MQRTPRQKERLAKLRLEAPIHNLKEKRLKTQAADLARQLREGGQMPADSGGRSIRNRDQYRGL